MPKERSNGEGSIVKLSNGKYKGVVTVDVIYNPDNTVQKQIRKTFTSEKKSTVQKWMADLIDQRNKHKLVNPVQLSVEQWLNVWLEKYKKNKLKPKTYESYKSVKDTHIIPAIGKKNIQDLKTSDLQGLYTKKVEEKKAPQTVKHIHIVIHGALKQALKEGLVARNVSESCELPKLVRKEFKVLSEQETKQLLEANKQHPLYALLLLELGTGLRCAELTALHWKDIDLDNGLLYVRGNISETTDGVIYQTTPKTKSSLRTIPLPASVVEELKLYKAKQKATKTDDIVFKNRLGGYIRPSTLTQTFKDVMLRNAGLPRCNFHSLRHTHATQLLTLNVNPKIIQQRLGHSSISTTLDIYSHALPHLQQEAAEKINEVLKL